MKKVPSLMLFVVLIASASAESAVVPAPATVSMLSFSLAPNVGFLFGHNGELGNLAATLPFGSANLGGTISCLYRLPASPLCLGADIGCSYMTLYDMEENWSGNLSMLHAESQRRPPAEHSAHPEFALLRVRRVLV